MILSQFSDFFVIVTGYETSQASHAGVGRVDSLLVWMTRGLVIFPRRFRGFSDFFVTVTGYETSQAGHTRVGRVSLLLLG